jgi:hypothetical protein
MLCGLLVTLPLSSRAKKMPNMRPWISSVDRQDCALTKAVCLWQIAPICPPRSPICRVAGVEIIDGQIILSAGPLDFVIRLEGMPKAAKMLTPGRRRWGKWLVWAERHSPIGDLVFGLPIDVKRLLWLLSDRQNERLACLAGKGGRRLQWSPVAPAPRQRDRRQWLHSTRGGGGNCVRAM